MSEEYALIFDCGSTNLRSVIIDSDGRVITYVSRPNHPQPQINKGKRWLVWDMEEIWLKICSSAKEAVKRINPRDIKAVIVTTWGADGAPVKRNGELTYPPISWQCPRTRSIIRDVTDKISPWEIFKITGYQVISFNTLLKIIWLKKNEPKSLEKAYTWLMMPGLIVQRLTGRFHIDPTSGSTTMAMNLKKRDWSETMLEIAGIEPNFFPEWYEPGENIGYVTEKAARKSSIPPGTPVITGGHDTQFAIIGSGAKGEEAILSSGTWEILSFRANSFNPTRTGFNEGLIIEADIQKGYWNPQLLMIGSAVLEWVREMFFRDLSRDIYQTLIKEAEEVEPRPDSIIFIPSFVRDSGPTRKLGVQGTILGLTLDVTRGQIYRAALEGLSFQLRMALNILARATGFKAKAIRVVGGGSKNYLWNRIRADVTGLPVIASREREATALGAAMIAFLGVDVYQSLSEAQRRIHGEGEEFRTGIDGEIYDKIFRRYMEALKSLKNFYREE